MEFGLSHNTAFSNLSAGQFKLRLDERNNGTSLFQNSKRRRQHFCQRNKGQVHHHQIHALSDVLDDEIARIESLFGNNTLITPQLPHQLVSPHIERMHFGRSLLKKAVGKTTRRCSEICTNPPCRINPEFLQRALDLKATPAHIFGSISHPKHHLVTHFLTRFRHPIRFGKHLPRHNETLGLLTGITKTPRNQHAIHSFLGH